VWWWWTAHGCHYKHATNLLAKLLDVALVLLDGVVNAVQHALGLLQRNDGSHQALRQLQALLLPFSLL